MSKEDKQRPPARGFPSRGLPALGGLPAKRAPSPGLVQIGEDEGGARDDKDNDNDDDKDSFDVTCIKAEEEERVQWEVFHRLKKVKRQAMVNTHRRFSLAAKDIQYQMFDIMEKESHEAAGQLNDPSYQQISMQKAITGMLESSMADMYTNAMN